MRVAVVSWLIPIPVIINVLKIGSMQQIYNTDNMNKYMRLSLIQVHLPFRSSFAGSRLARFGS